MDLQQELNSIPEKLADVYKPAAIILNAKGEVFLIESKRKPGVYKTLGGRIEEGETIIQCIARELEEEVKVKNFEVKRRIFKAPVHPSIDEPNIKVQLDFFEIELHDPIEFDYEQNKDFVWASVEDIKAVKYPVSDTLLQYMIPNL